MANKSNAPWSPEEEALLRELLLSRKHLSFIGAKLKRSQSAVATRAQIIGISLRSRTSRGETDETP